jgi:hypothetical protein
MRKLFVLLLFVPTMMFGQLKPDKDITFTGTIKFDHAPTVLQGGSYVPITNNYVAKTEVFPVYTFTAGSNNVGDTSVFNTSAIYGAFRNSRSDSLIVTGCVAVMSGEAGDTLGVKVLWHPNLGSASAKLLTSAAIPVGRPLGLISGTVATSTTDHIPPDVWVWMTTSYVKAGAKPKYLVVTLSGYLQ